MANSKQSLKRARQNADRYKLKHSQRSQARTAVKAVRNAIADNNKESAAELLKTAEKVLDTVAAKKVIHKNAAARTKSRLVKAVKAIQDADVIMCPASAEDRPSIALSVISSLIDKSKNQEVVNVYN